MKELEFYIVYGIVGKDAFTTVYGGYEILVKEGSNASEKMREIHKEIVKKHNSDPNCYSKLGLITADSIVIKVLTRLN
jgi:hypothetical protein